jgi:uncharacterized protein
MLGKLNDFQIDRLLLTQTIAHLGCHSNNRTYVVPISYVYADGYIYGYTIEGLKISMMRENPDICLQVEKIEDSAHWQSVILWGTFEELTAREADHAIQTITSRLHPFITSETTRPAHSMQKMQGGTETARKTVAFRIHIKEKTGRFERQ